MKALLIIAPENFRDEELFHTKEELEKEGIETKVVSLKKGICKGMLGSTFEVKNSVEEINIDEYDAIIFVGGSGTPMVRNNEKAIEIAKEAYEKGKVVAAICWAPTILAKAGILNGKKATVWLGFDPEYNCNTDEVLKKYGATFVNKPLVVDGKIVTANGPRAARDFGKEIAKLLK